MAAPVINVTNVTATRISAQATKDVCTVTFQADQDLVDWEARADGAGVGQGLLVGAAADVRYNWTKWDALAWTFATLDSKGLMFSNIVTVLPGTVDIITNGDLSLTAATTQPWDTTKNPYGVYALGGWSTGYNGGVAAPTTGYHAHLNPTAGADGGPAFEYIDKNSEVGQRGRWMGINRSLTANISTIGWKLGTKITLTVDVKTDTAGKYVQCGLYHQDATTAANTFGNDIANFTPSAVNVWQTLSQTFDIDSGWKLDGPAVLYLYGYFGPEGICWIDNVRLVVQFDGEFQVDNEELTNGDKSYKINTYGRNAAGEVTPYA